MTFSPDVWGPAFWKVIHIVAYYLDHLYLTDPEEAKRKWSNFLKGITFVVPCKKCESHFTKFQKDHPPPMSSRGKEDPQFLKWTVNAHNAVRLRNNKFAPKVEDVVQAYREGHVYELPQGVSLHKSMTSMTLDSCYVLKSQITGWQVGFGLACGIVFVLFVILMVQLRKRHRKK